MGTLLLLLIGFLLAGVALVALTLVLNDYERRVGYFCDVVRERYRPGVYSELEEQASRQIEALAKSNRR